MRSIRSSRTLTILVVLVVAGALVAGTALAVSVQEHDAPDETEVGNPAQASATITDLYTEHDEGWDLLAQTELRNASWTVRYYDATGELIETQEEEGSAVRGADVSTPVDRIEIEVLGQTPPVEEYTYPDENTYVPLQVRADVAGAIQTIDSWSTVHYTADSREARQALDSARAAIQEAEDDGANTDEAEDSLESGQTAYQDGSFGSAIDFAEQAEQQANDAQEETAAGQQRTQLILLGVGAVVVLLLVGGGIYYYRESQKQDTKLR